MYKKIKKIISLILIFVLALTLASCKDENTELPAPNNKNEIWGQNINLFSYYPDTLNPYLTAIKENYDILSLIYEPLFAVNANGEAVPRLAAESEISEDGLTVKVKLKENVFFQSGKAFGASDVVFTLKYISEYAPEFLYIFNNIASYYADNGSVVFRLKAPQFNFDSCLSFPILSDKLNVEVFNSGFEKPDGCGAFSLDVASLRQKEMKLIKNENYYISERPYATSITVKLLKDSSVAVSAFNSGEISAITSDEFVWGDVSFVNDHDIFEYGGENFYFLAFNYDNTLLCDQNVRNLINSSINKEQIAAKVFQGHAFCTNSILNSAFECGNFYSNEYDLDNAAGYAKNANLTDKDKNGFYEKTIEDTDYALTFNVLANADDDKIMKIADLLSKDMQDAKVRFNITALSGEDYLLAFEEKNYDIVIAKEKIRCGENLASKLDFDGKYDVPYEMYEKLSKIIFSADKNNAAEKMREFNNEYLTYLPCVALCYDSSALVCHYSLKNMSAFQNSRYFQISESFIEY